MPRRTLTTADAIKLGALIRLLDEAYAHYFEFGPGGGKSSEAHVSLHFGHYWDRLEPGDSIQPRVEIYSYIFGRGGRTHDFESIDAALEEVRAWHAEEMQTRYDENGDVTS